MDIKKSGYEEEGAHGTSSGSCPMALNLRVLLPESNSDFDVTMTQRLGLRQSYERSDLHFVGTFMWHMLSHSTQLTAEKCVSHVMLRWSTNCKFDLMSNNMKRP
jgi:hypothetical protein